MKIIIGKKKNFNKTLDAILSLRKKKVESKSQSVIKIINDVKKNGDKALLKYEKKFNKNKIITPSPKEFSNFILYKNIKIFHTQINLRIN